MSIERVEKLARVSFDIAHGAVTGVTATLMRCMEEDGKEVPGTGSYAEAAYDLADPALVAVLGEVNAGLVARVAELEVHVEAQEAKVAELEASVAEVIA